MCNKNFYIVRRFFRVPVAGFFTRSTVLHFGHLNREPASASFPFIDLKFCFAFRTYYNHCLFLLGNQSFIVTRPMRNPPM